MLKLKTTALAVLVAGCSVASAGTMGPVCAPGNVTVPCANSAWDFGAKALYLQTSLGAINFPNYVPDATGINRWNNNGNPWGWGFMIEGSYHFGTGSDVNLNWYHLNDKQTISRTGPVIVALGDIRADNPLITTRPNWDAVNLEVGQHVDYSQNASVRFHGGVEYVRVNLKRNYAALVSGDVSIGTRSLLYNGFGPRVGADAFYNFNNGFAVYAKSALGLYAGTSSFKWFASVPSISANTIGHIGSSMIVVPELEAKLGASYTYAMSLGDVSLDAGWMWVNYFGALVDAQDNLVHSQNFGLQGPYIGLKWVGNLA